MIADMSASSTVSWAASFCFLWPLILAERLKSNASDVRVFPALSSAIGPSSWSGGWLCDCDISASSTASWVASFCFQGPDLLAERLGSSESNARTFRALSSASTSSSLSGGWLCDSDKSTSSTVSWAASLCFQVPDLLAERLGSSTWDVRVFRALSSAFGSSSLSRGWLCDCDMSAASTVSWAASFCFLWPVILAFLAEISGSCEPDVLNANLALRRLDMNHPSANERSIAECRHQRKRL